jgi:integrase
MWCGRKQVTAERTKRRPNGTGSVYKMSGARAKPWRAVASVNGKRVPIGCYTTQTDALKALAAYEPQGSVIRSDMTLEEVYEAWSETKTQSLSESSRVMYKSAWNHFDHIRNLAIAELRTQDYQKIIDALRSSHSRSSCEKVKILASQLCKWALQNDIIDKNYAEYISLPVEKKTEERKYFTDEEIEKLWNYQHDRTAQIVLVMIYTGMRINELFALKICDVHLDEKISPSRTVSYVVGGEKTEAGRNRIIVLHSRILPFVRQWCEEGGAHLLCNKHGGMMDDRNWRERLYYPLLDDLGILRVSPHKARHTFASRGAKAGISPTVLQKLMGHENYETTADYYTHVDIAQLADGVEMLK